MSAPLADNIVSTNLIKRYINCPRSCRLKYVDKCQSSNKNEWIFKAGRSGHKILEHFYEKLDLSNPDINTEFTEKFKASAFQYWDRGIDSRKRDEINPLLSIWLKNEIDRFKIYKEKGFIDIFKPIEVEQDLTDYKNKMRAVIDKRCKGMSGITYVIDYKFDRKLPALRNWKNILSEIDIDYKIQAAMNVMVLKSYGYQVDSFFFQFISMPDKLLSVPLIPQLFEEVNNIITKIRSDTTFEKNEKSCFLCDVKMYCNLKESSINCL